MKASHILSVLAALVVGCFAGVLGERYLAASREPKLGRYGFFSNQGMILRYDTAYGEITVYDKKREKWQRLTGDPFDGMP